MELNELTLDGILDDCLTELRAGVKAAAHAWHTAVLATVDNGRPSARTVVVRYVADDMTRIVCHTDARSAKCGQLLTTPAASWLLYDASRKIQLRLSGPAELHSDDSLADRRWSESRLGSRRCYLAAAPGSELDAPTSPLPVDLRDRRPDADEAQPGRSNFAVIVGHVDRLDWLLLTADGHRRARFAYRAGRWDGGWRAP